MLNQYRSKISGLAICLGIMSGGAYANGEVDSLTQSNTNGASNTSSGSSYKQSFKTTLLKKLELKPLLDNEPEKFGYKNGSKLGLFMDDIVVSGTVRFLTIYRNMDEAYTDMRTSLKNISFVDYPLGGAAVAQGAYPHLELNLSSKLTKNVDFNVGYSMAYFFTGNQETDATRFASSIQNLRFGTNYHSSIGKFTLNAGQILPVKMSKFTLGQPIYRDDYFDRLPWDWYRNSFLRYDEYYSLKLNMGGQNESRALFSGAVLTGSIIPLGVNITSFVGRSSLTAPYNAGATGFPGVLYGSRIEKSLFTRKLSGKLGVNAYMRRGYTSIVSNLKDNNNMYTLDGDVKMKGLKLATEVGLSKLNNPFVNAFGFGTQFRAELDRTYLPLPIYLDLYYIEANFANYDGSIINTNRNLRQGGSSTGLADDPTVFTNINQEVSQYANNRMGVILKTDVRIAKKLTIDFGYAASEELQNLNDSVVSMQHRVNAFTRSRFNQWKMQTGNYQRVRSIFRRTVETFTISNPSSGHKKGFNAVEALAMFKTKLFTRDVILMSYHTFASTQEKFSPIPTWDEKSTYIQQYYVENTIAYNFAKKLVGVFDYSVQKAKGGLNTKLGENGKPFDQLGTSLGFGIDYDFVKTGSLHLRHKWFNHKDVNFVLDKFKGQETYLELKFFF